MKQRIWRIFRICPRVPVVAVILGKTSQFLYQGMHHKLFISSMIWSSKLVSWPQIATTNKHAWVTASKFSNKLQRESSAKNIQYISTVFIKAFLIYRWSLSKNWENKAKPNDQVVGSVINHVSTTNPLFTKEPCGPWRKQRWAPQTTRESWHSKWSKKARVMNLNW